LTLIALIFLEVNYLVSVIVPTSVVVVERGFLTADTGLSSE